MEVKSDVLADLPTVLPLADELLHSKLKSTISDKGGFINDLAVKVQNDVTRKVPVVVIGVRIEYLTEDDLQGDEVLRLSEEFARHIESTYLYLVKGDRIDLTPFKDTILHDQSGKISICYY